MSGPIVCKAGLISLWFWGKGKDKKLKGVGNCTKKDPFELDSASWMGFNGRRGRKLVRSASGFGKKSMISGHCTKKDPFDFMYGGFFILAQVAV